MALDNNVASFDIPAAKVESPTLEYYFAIIIGSRTLMLPTGGAGSPGSVSVGKVVSSTASAGVASISATPVFNPSPVRSFTNVQSTLDLSTVSVKMNTVTLMYRRSGDAAFKSLALTLSNKVATGSIPGIDVRAPGIEYYFLIKLDTLNTEATLPSDGPSNPLSLAVPVLTRIVPDFGPLKSKSSGSVSVNFSSLQANVTAVSLFYRKQDEPTFTELILTPSGQVATGQIPAAKVRFPRLEYYASLRFDDGSSVIVPQDGPSNPFVIPVQAIQRELRIPGQTGSLQKKVLVLKWSE